MQLRAYIKHETYEESLAKHLEEALDRLYLSGEINQTGTVTEYGHQQAALVGWLLGHPTGK